VAGPRFITRFQGPCQDQSQFSTSDFGIFLTMSRQTAKTSHIYVAGDYKSACVRSKFSNRVVVAVYMCVDLFTARLLDGAP
jgi:hypothetical protein